TAQPDGETPPERGPDPARIRLVGGCRRGWDDRGCGHAGTTFLRGGGTSLSALSGPAPRPWPPRRPPSRRARAGPDCYRRRGAKCRTTHSWVVLAVSVPSAAKNCPRASPRPPPATGDSVA